jgi:hypothetical protein
MNDLFDRCNQFYKAARKVDDIAILQANIGKYIHFSSSDRFGISYHKNIHPGNPRGVYGFPLTFGRLAAIANNKVDAFDDYGWNKYIYIFEVGGNILNMDTIDLKEISSKVREFARSKYPSIANWHVRYTPEQMPYQKDGHMFMQWINQVFDDYKQAGVFKNEHSAANILIRGAGYDAMETKSYGFGDDIGSEICVLNPSVITLVAKVNNPMLNKEQLKEVEYYASDAYKEEQRLKEKKYEEDMLMRLQEIKKMREKLDKEREEYLKPYMARVKENT